MPYCYALVFDGVSARSTTLEQVRFVTLTLAKVIYSTSHYALAAQRRSSDCVLDPDQARTRPIGAIDPLGHNALGAKPTSVLEHGSPRDASALPAPGTRTPTHCAVRRG